MRGGSPPPMASQTAIKTRAANVRVDERAHNGEQIVERQRKCFAQRHCYSLLRLRLGRLQPMMRMVSIVNVDATPPVPDRLLGDRVPVVHQPGRQPPGFTGIISTVLILLP